MRTELSRCTKLLGKCGAVAGKVIAMTLMAMCTRVLRTKKVMVDTIGGKLEYGKDNVADDGRRCGEDEEGV